MSVTIEICANSYMSALAAFKGGAQRIELCENLSEGGTTPSIATIKRCVQQLNLKIHVLIRPRAGDFLYNEEEFEIMLEDIKAAKAAGAHGIVSGVLTKEGNVDVSRMIQLIESARPLSFTFHRAFDMCSDPFKAMEDLIQLGVDRVLTSGLANTAWEGKELIKELIKKANAQIIFMPGSGVNADNVLDLINYTDCREVHLSAKAKQKSRMEYIKGDVSMGGNLALSEYEWNESNPHIVKEIVERCKSIPE